MDWEMQIAGPFQWGEEVGAYKASDWPNWVVLPEGPPPGSPVAMAIIPSPAYEGFVFKGLEADTKYYMAQEVVNEERWRYEPFWTTTPTRYAIHAEIELERTNKELEALEGRVEALEGP